MHSQHFDAAKIEKKEKGGNFSRRTVNHDQKRETRARDVGGRASVALQGKWSWRGPPLIGKEVRGAWFYLLRHIISRSGKSGHGRVLKRFGHYRFPWGESKKKRGETARPAAGRGREKEIELKFAKRREGRH